MSLAGPTSIEEGDTATFTITASHQPFGANRPISINVEKLSGGNFIRASELGRTTSTRFSDTSPVEFEVQTRVDSVGSGGTFRVTLEDLQFYAVSPTAYTITTTVTDPTVTSVFPIREIARTAVEPSTGSGSVDIRFEPNASVQESAVTIAVDESSTATLGVDFTLPENPVLAAAVEKNNIPITILADDLDEDEERIVLNLSFADTVDAEFDIPLEADNSKMVTVTITINDNEGDVEPHFTPRYTLNNAGKLEVSKNIGSFDLEFDLSAPSGRDVQIGYTVRDADTDLVAGDYLINSSAANTGEITVFAGETRGRVPISIIAAGIGDGEDLALDLTYSNATTQTRDPITNEFSRTQAVIIAVVNRPSISIETIYTEVSRTDYIEFEVKINPPQNRRVTVNYVESGNSFTTDPNAFIWVQPNNSQPPKRHPFHRNSGVGTYSITLSPLSGFVLNPSKTRIDVEVVDGANLPTISWGGVPTVTKVDTSFNIAVNSVGGIQSDVLPVRYIVTDTGGTKGYYSTPGEVETLEIPTERTYSLPVPIDRTQDLTGNGRITVTLIPGPGYKLGTRERHIPIPQHDRPAEALPIVSIESPFAGTTGYGVTEGKAFDFTVSIEEVLSENLVIDLTLGDDSDTIDPVLSFGAGVISNQITIMAGDLTAPGTVMVGGDVRAADNVRALVAINDTGSTTYTKRLNHDNIAVLIKDNDGTPTADNPAITLEVVGGATSIEEGDSIIFRALADPSTTEELTVNLMISEQLEANETSRFLDDTQSEMVTITIGAGLTGGTYELHTRPINTIVDDAGQIIALITDGHGYALPDADTTIKEGVTITDVVLPTLSLASDYTKVYQGFVLPFEITKVGVREIGDINLSLFDSGATEVAATITPLTSGANDDAIAGTITVPSTAGTYTLRIDSPVAIDRKYALGSTAEISFEVLAQTPATVLTIAKDQETVNEGPNSNATFTVTAAPATNVDLRVGVSVKDIADRTTDYITEAYSL